jgi:altronate hydrolase
MPQKNRALAIDASDNVAVAVEGATAGEALELYGQKKGSVTAVEDIPPGHKLALSDIAPGALVIKYGHPIGLAKKAVKAGAWIHSHNLGSGLETDIAYAAPGRGYAWPADKLSELRALASAIPGSFKGYRRKDGRAAIRKELWIIPTVGCVNKAADRMAAIATDEFGLEARAITHPYGCSQLGDDLGATRRVLAALAMHPNAAAVLIISLGCENNRVEGLMEALGGGDRGHIGHVCLQDAGDEYQAAREFFKQAKAELGAMERTDIPLSELRVGLKCGGSDGYSGITANPLVGRAADLLASRGAGAVMSEVPEMFGAETILMERSASPEVFEALAKMVSGYKEYFRAHGQPVYENPSPGNRDGGITTLEEKSLGCIKKAGIAPVAQILPYGGRADPGGLCLVSGPGNDAVSCTALACAGAHMILFTTGRGTPFGGPAPTMKISTNSALALKKPSWIDFDSGRLLESGSGFDALAVELARLCVEVAGGRKTKAEENGFHEIAILKDGVTL